MFKTQKRVKGSDIDYELHWAAESLEMWIDDMNGVCKLEVLKKRHRMPGGSGRTILLNGFSVKTIV